MNDLKIEAIETSKTKVAISDYQKNHIIPKHPFRAILSGASGSGKSNLLINLLTKDKFYKNYFHVIFLISPTAGKLDDSFIALDKSKSKSKIHIINELKPEVIQNIMNKNKELIEDKGVDKSPRLLLVYDDIISNVKFMNTKPFRHSFIASRHYNASVIVCTQRYNSVPRVCRLQSNAVLFFRGTNSEEKVLADEYTPPGYKKKEFLEIIAYATRTPYSFLFINEQADARQRYRENLGNILELVK